MYLQCEKETALIKMHFKALAIWKFDFKEKGKSPKYVSRESAVHWSRVIQLRHKSDRSASFVTTW